MLSLYSSLAFAFALLVSPSLCQPWVAIALDRSYAGYASLQALYNSTNAGTAGYIGDHVTIVFNPDNATLAHLQTVIDQNLTFHVHVLGYVNDNHGQAVSVHIDPFHGKNAQYNIQSTNTNPHVTVSASLTSPYTAVYSQNLWQRAFDNGLARVRRDDAGKPYKLKRGKCHPKKSEIELSETHDDDRHHKDDDSDDDKKEQKKKRHTKDNPHKRKHKHHESDPVISCGVVSHSKSYLGVTTYGHFAATTIGTTTYDATDASVLVLKHPFVLEGKLQVCHGSVC